MNRITNQGNARSLNIPPLPQVFAHRFQNGVVCELRITMPAYTFLADFEWRGLPTDDIRAEFEDWRDRCLQLFADQIGFRGFEVGEENQWEEHQWSTILLADIATW